MSRSRNAPQEPKQDKHDYDNFSTSLDPSTPYNHLSCQNHPPAPPPGKGSEIGDFLTTHPMVNCISFTGGETGDNHDVWM
jgi:hypothetical protein